MQRVWLAMAVVLWGAVAVPGYAAPIPVGGRIVDSGGRPVRGAAVELVPLPVRFVHHELELQDKDSEPVARTASRDDGRFEVAAPAAGMWQVRVAARGFVPRRYVLMPLIEPTELPLLEMAAEVSLRVRVLDGQGKPVPGARVEASSRMYGETGWWVLPQRAVTSPDGTVQVVCTKGSGLRVETLAPGHPMASADIETEAPAAEIRLAPGCARLLRVTLQGKGDEPPRPAAGALVTADGWALGLTDAAGALGISTPCDRELRVLVADRDGRQAQIALRPGGAAGSQAAPVEARLPAQPARISGRVIEDGSRKPLAGALVWPEDDPAAFVTTDGQGAYTLKAPVAGRSQVWGAALGYLQTGGDASTGTGPTLPLKPLATVSGKVVDEAGRPVPDALLYSGDLTGWRGGIPLARSGPQGTFQLRVLPGEGSTLKASHPGFTTAWLPLSALAARESRTGIQVVLKRGLTAFGRVTDAETRPLAGVQVSLFPAAAGDDPFQLFDETYPEPVPPVTTDAQGSFVLEHLEPGRFELEAKARGFAPTLVPGIELADGSGRVDLGTVTLAPGASLRGIVVDPADAPIAGAQIQAEPRMGLRPGASLSWEDGGSVETAADGTFSLPDLRPGEILRVSVSKRGYLGAAFNGVEVPNAEPLRVVLTPGSRISGRVVDESGDPVARALVTLSQVGAQRLGTPIAFAGDAGIGQTGEDGRFTLEGVGAAKLHLSVAASGFLPAELPQIEVTAGKDVEGLEVVLERGAVITGRVIGPDGEPLPRVLVSLVQDRLNLLLGSAGGLSDGDGGYRLEGVLPGARSVAAEGSGYQRVVRDLEVRPGENRLDFRLEPGHEVAGRVVDAAGQPVDGATVSVTAPGEAGLEVSSPDARSGADGSFRIPAVATGVYDIQARKDGYAPGRLPAVRVSGPVEGLEVRLEAGGAIRGQLSGLDFADLGGINVVAFALTGETRNGRVDYQGRYRVEGLGAGEWRVAAFTRDGLRAHGQVTVVQGSEAVLDLEIGGGHTLSGRVVRAGEPVTNVFVTVSGADGLGGGIGETDHQGAFRITGLDAGTYQLEVRGYNSGIAQRQTVEISGDQEIVIEIFTRQVSGRVVDATDQSPLAKVRLTLERLEEAPGWSLPSVTTSDADGTFVLADVSPGAYRLLAQLEGYAGAEVSVQVGGANDAGNVRVALQPTEGLTLQVSRTVGAPPEDVQVALLNDAGRALLTGSHPTGENGRVRVPSAPPGRWRLLVSAGGSATVAQTVQVPGPPARVVLPVAAALIVTAPGLASASSVTLVGSDGQPFRQLSYSTAVGEWPLLEEGAHIGGLPPGRWRVRVTSPDGQTREASVTLSPGSTSRVVLP